MKVCTVPSKPSFAPVTIQITIEDEGDLALLWAAFNLSATRLEDSTMSHPGLKKKALKKYAEFCGAGYPPYVCITGLVNASGIKD